MANFWDSNVWGGFNLLAVVLISLLAANALKKGIKWLDESLIPTSVLGGGLLLILAEVYTAIAHKPFFDTAFFGGNGYATLEIITYHTLALGFIAATLKSSDVQLTRQRANDIFNTGVTTVSTYLLQAVVGFGITLIAASVIAGFFPAAGVLLPFGFGQGTGQAMNYGTIYETEHGFVGGKTFGLTIAALGFLSASLGGVVHLNVLKKKGKITRVKREEGGLQSEEIQADNEIPMQGSMDKLTVQLALVAAAYFITYFLMGALGNLIPGI
ncbi:MAG: hypothetical protein J6R77_00480, partial [Clostridia bacterium]|nr:hypothetical protein [Clostridia bacterium]